VVADALEAVGVSRVLTMDLHSAPVQGFFHVPVDNLYALPVFTRTIRELVASETITRPVLVAPDAGSATLARHFQHRLKEYGAGLALGEKVRPHQGEESAATALLGDVRGRDAILVDDIIFTGGTLCNMAERIMAEGARSVRALATHALLTGNAVECILASPIAELLVTDTVPVSAEKSAALGPRLRQVSVAPLFAEAIRSVHEKTSVGRLFN